MIRFIRIKMTSTSNPATGTNQPRVTGITLHVVLKVAWKLALAAVVLLAGPYGNFRWGDPYEGPGMNQIDVLFTVLFVSFILAALLVGAFTVSGFVLHRRSLKTQAIVDFILFAIFLTLSVYIGISAHVGDQLP
jgi:hypothetical protein